MMQINPIAHIKTDFPTKFGIPRQPGVVAGLQGSIIFEPEYANSGCIRGLEDFSYLWLLWGFSENCDENGKSRWSPTVRPPRLGGNKRLGVFATRSPFRPNPIGMSAVRIERIEPETPQGPVIHVLGADMVDGTPIYDIKPYISYADSIPDASGGFTDETEYQTLRVQYSGGNIGNVSNIHPIQTSDSVQPVQNLSGEREAGSVSADYIITGDLTDCYLIGCNTDFDYLSVILSRIYGVSMNGLFLKNLTGILSNDPRPHYQKNPNRIYGLEYAGYEVKFSVDGDLLTVVRIIRA